MNKWSIKSTASLQKIETLQKQLGINPIFCNLLINRGVETFDQAKMFFRPKISDLHNPYLMKDMKKAVDRIEQAINQDEKILIYGDYDVDGVTSVVLFSSFLKSIYPHVITYIPDRQKEGYGISDRGITFAQNNNIGLIISLDCGIKSIDKVDDAKRLNIDFIICDHHLPDNNLPEAVAILNPKQKDCPYPFKHLCGCGVGFKLIQAMMTKTKPKNTSLEDYLELVVIAIAADIVPIVGENRVLATLGLKALNNNPRLGLKLLLPNTAEQIKISDIVFKIAPHINATGRIDHANRSVKLLLESHEEEVKSIASSIISINSVRRELDAKVTREALEQIVDNQEQEDLCTVVYDATWHKGVVGITASRLIEQYYRPTIVLTKSENAIVGSGRSVSGFDLHKAISACSTHLTKFGGHAHAVGLSLNEDSLEAFKNSFQNYVKSNIEPDRLIREIQADAKILLSDISKKFVRLLSQFAPFGPQNMTPIFYGENLKDFGTVKTLGKNDEHLSLMISQETSQHSIRAIGFGLGKKLELIKANESFKAMFSIEENFWRGKTSLQIRLRDVKV